MSEVYRQGSIIYLTTDDRQRFYYDSAARPLGSGAMGVVYRGYDDHGRPVAVKRVNDRYSAIPAIRHKAKTEASLMFSHYNLVEMLGYCEVMPDRGPIFIISRFVQGHTVDKFVEMNRNSFDNPTRKICELIFPVFDALAYLHNQKIVHADIKPSNIMVEAGHNVRLMDLGIAQLCDTGGSSGTGGLMGTPRYAAPEQFSAQSQATISIDSRTDIYELGVTIYELLTGENPFEGKNVAEIRNKHKTTSLPYHQDVPRAVVNVLRRATHPAPLHRYQDVTAFKKALQQALNAPKGISPRTWIWIAAGILSAIVTILSLLILL